MSIRIADLEDLETVSMITAATISEVYPHYYPAGAVAYFLSHHHRERIAGDIQQGMVFLCLDDTQNPVGTVTMKRNEICRLFVLPQYQGRGYGRELLDFAEQTIGESYHEIILDASLPAKDIYLKRGYSVTDYHKIAAENGDFLCYDVMVKKEGNA